MALCWGFHIFHYIIDFTMIGRFQKCAILYSIIHMIQWRYYPLGIFLVRVGPGPLQWRHDECYGVSNCQPHDCLFNRSFKAQIKENIKAPRHHPLWEEFTGDRWIPRTKGQQRGICFHVMTSSCCVKKHWIFHKSWFYHSLPCHNFGWL